MEGIRIIHLRSFSIEEDRKMERSQEETGGSRENCKLELPLRFRMTAPVHQTRTN